MTPKEAAPQIDRLSAIEAMNDAKYQELLEVAVRRFPDVKSLRLAVDGLLNDKFTAEVPSPGYFGALAPALERRIGCEKCDGTGMKLSSKVLEYRGKEYPFFERCECRVAHGKASA